MLACSVGRQTKVGACPSTLQNVTQFDLEDILLQRVEWDVLTSESADVVLSFS